MMRRPHAWLALLGLVVASVAFAQVGQRTFGVHFSGGTADVSYSAADFADATIREDLGRGIQQEIVVRTFAYETGSTTPFAVTTHRCLVTWELWRAHPSYQVEEQTGASRQVTTSLATTDEVVQHCLVASHLPIGRPSIWAAHSGQQIAFGVVVEFNPITPDDVQRARRWIVRPEEDDTFFGSFVSLFVNRGLGQAERTLTFRSQDITCP